MEGAFCWNQTLLAPLGSKATVIVETSKWSSWGNHARNALYVESALLHFKLKEYYMCDTQDFVITVGKFHPAHCRVPAISEADQMIVPATDIIKEMKNTVLESAARKRRHTNMLKKLLTILDNTESPRMIDSGQPRVSPVASMSADPTSPRVMAGTRFVHQRQTRHNAPLPRIEEEATVVETTPTL